MAVDPLRLSAFVSVVGAAGNVAYLQHIYRRPTHSPLEGRLVFLLVCITLVYVLRSLYWVLGGDALRTISLVPATFLPLGAALFVEVLRRRHAPPPVKYLLAIGTLVGFALNLVLIRPVAKEYFFDFFRWFTIATFAWSGLWLLLRARDDLSPMENRFVDGIAVACGLGVVFAATDFSVRPSFIPYHLGGLGGLFLVYVCVRQNSGAERRRNVLFEIGRLFIEAGVITAAAWIVIGEAPSTTYWAIFFLSLAFDLYFRISARLRGLQIKSGTGMSFSRWLLFSNTRTIDGFVESLQSVPWGSAPVVLRGSDLDPYDTAAIAAVFDDAHPIWTLSTLRAASRDATGEEADGVEELIDMLETRDMTHVTLMVRRPMVLLLINLPEVAGPQHHTMEFALLQKYSRLLEQDDRPNA